MATASKTIDMRYETSGPCRGCVLGDFQCEESEFQQDQSISHG